MDKLLYKDLNSALENYRNGNYEIGNYSSIDNLIEDVSKGKTFVFSGKIYGSDYGSLGLGIFVLILIPFILLIACGSLERESAYIGTIIILGIMGPITVIFIILGIFILCFKPKEAFVLGPKGVLKISPPNKAKCFSWKDILEIKTDLVTMTQGARSTPIKKQIYIFINNKNKIKVDSNTYNRDEFPLDNWRELFCNLCLIYWEQKRESS